MTTAAEVPLSLEGKVVIVTGAAHGQGAAEASLIATLGATTVVTDLDEPAGAALADELSGRGLDARFFAHDVTSEDDWQRVVGRVAEDHGAITGLVNNAGVGQQRAASVLASDVDEFRRVLEVNLVGPLLGMQVVGRHMRDHGRPSAIVNIGSIAAMTAYPTAAYCSSKWGLRGLTKVAAMELADAGIRVNAVHPGLIDTQMSRGAPPQLLEAFIAATPVGRIGQAEDVAALVAFLLSDAAAFITGADLPVDGGLTAGSDLRQVWTAAGFGAGGHREREA